MSQIVSSFGERGGASSCKGWGQGWLLENSQAGWQSVVTPRGALGFQAGPPWLLYVFLTGWPFMSRGSSVSIVNSEALRGEMVSWGHF